jgi:hypothetical protein
MSLERILIVLALLIALFVAWHLDNFLWARKSAQELRDLASSDNWRSWKSSLVELRKRGEEIDSYLPKLLGNLVADSRIIREAARITLIDVFPDTKAWLGGFDLAAPPEVIRAKLAALFSKPRDSV